MARDFLDIGPSPSGEPCSQVGSDNYHDRARKECDTFLHQLRRQFGLEPGSARLAVKSFPHDFGSYLEVVCYYDDQDEVGVEYAYKLEAETPEFWDDRSRVFLDLPIQTTKE